MMGSVALMERDDAKIRRRAAVEAGRAASARAVLLLSAATDDMFCLRCQCFHRIPLIVNL